MLRYEKKYLVPNELMDYIRKRLSSFVRLDDYAITAESGLRQYTVRSIYFDSRDMIYYSEKVNGLQNRRKFRIRGYNQYDDNSKVVLEIKRKIENRVKKHRCFVLFRNVNQLLTTGSIEDFVIESNGSETPVEEAQRFLFHINKYQLLPTCLIVYEREAWFGRFDTGVRITFDKNIRSKLYPELERLYDNHNFTPLFTNHFILEIKYFSDTMPVWTRSLIQEFRLRNEALSKYAIGVDVCNNGKQLTY